MQNAVVTSLKKIVPAPVKRAMRHALEAEQGWTYNRDGLATQHNCDFIGEPKFAQAYAAGKATGSWGGSDVQWRAHTIAWAANQARNLPGDFVECGVDRGGLASVALNYAEILRSDKRMYLFDTYEGLKAELISEEERRLGLKPGTYQDCYAQVVQTFKPFGDRVRVIRGAVPYTLDQFDGDRVSFLSIDMNCVAPEIAAMEFFYPKLVPGAVVVLDDYGWAQHINQKHAMDEFFRERPEEVLTLPTGQGLIVKL